MRGVEFEATGWCFWDVPNICLWMDGLGSSSTYSSSRTYFFKLQFNEHPIRLTSLETQPQLEIPSNHAEEDDL